MEVRATKQVEQEAKESKITLVHETTNYIANYQDLMTSLNQLATINTIDSLSYQCAIASLDQIAFNAANKIKTLSQDAQLYQANIVAFQQQAPLDETDIVNQVNLLNRKTQIENAKKTIGKKERIWKKIRNDQQKNLSPKTTLLELLGLHSKADIIKTMTTYQQFNQLEQIFNIKLHEYPREEIIKNLKHQKNLVETAMKADNNLQQQRKLLEPILETLECLNPTRKQVVTLKSELTNLINNLSKIDTKQGTIIDQIAKVDEQLKTLHKDKPKVFTKTKKGKQIIHKLEEQEQKKQMLSTQQEAFIEEKRKIELDIHQKSAKLSTLENNMDSIAQEKNRLNFRNLLNLKKGLEQQIEITMKQMKLNPYWNRTDKPTLQTLFSMNIPKTIPTTEERNNALNTYQVKASKLQSKETFAKQLKRI